MNFIRSCLKESGKILKLSAVVGIAQFCRYAMGVTDSIFLGRLGELQLAASSIGNSWSFATFFLVIGLIFAMDTLIAQAFGAKKYQQAGIILQTSLIVVTVSMVPVALMWWFTEPFLFWFHQKAEVAYYAGLFCKILIPSSWPFLYYRVLERYLQNQGVTVVTLIVAIIGFVANIGLNYIYIYPSKLGFVGGPLATSTSRAILPVLLFIFMMVKGYHKQTWPGWTKKAVSPKNLKIYLKLAVPSSIMCFLEIMGFQVMTLLSGFFSGTHMAAHAICYNILILCYVVPTGINRGCSTRVGLLLGKGHAKKARKAAYLGILMGLIFGAIISGALVGLSWEISMIWTENEEILKISSQLMKITALVSIVYGVEDVCWGILTGLGKPHIISVINLIGYYGVNLPLGIVFAFKMNWDVFGLWWGMLCGLGFILLAQLFFIARVDWEKEVTLAHERVSNDDEKIGLINTPGGPDSDM